MAAVLGGVALVIAGIVFWGITLFNQMRVTSAGQELQVLVPALRGMHQTDAVSPSERIELLNLPLAPNMFGKDFQGKTILLSPWKTRITLYPGSPMGWAGDDKNPEFTVWFESLPPEACAPLAAYMLQPSMRTLGVTSIFIGHDPPNGDRFCLTTNTYCKTAVVPSADELKASCATDDADQVSVFFGFAAH